MQGFKNDHSDSACIDELHFYGTPVGDSPVFDLPFATCHFNQTEMDSNQARQLPAGRWEDYEKRLVRCVFSKATISITKIWIKLCSEYKTLRNLTLILENDYEERCTAKNLKVSAKDSLSSFRQGELGTECTDFQVTSTTKVWAFTGDQEDMCLSHLLLDYSPKEGAKARSQVCKFDQDEFYKIYNQEKMSMPLICN